jgi:hypothetical protein
MNCGVELPSEFAVTSDSDKEKKSMRSLILWLVGIPLPIILILWLVTGHA